MAKKSKVSSRSSIRRGDDIAAQLMELKGVTLQLGTIHEAQKNQLQLWGWLAVPHASSFEVAVELPHLADDGTTVVNRHAIEYRVDAYDRPPKDLKKRLEGLDRSIKWLLGDEFAVTVKINQKAIFSRKGVAPKKQNVKKLVERLKNDDKRREDQR